MVIGQHSLSKETPKEGRSTARIVAGIGLGFLVLCGVAYGIDLALSSGSLPRGTTIAGVNVGGQDRQVALTTLQSSLDDATSKPVTVKAGEHSATFDPVAAGLTVDWDATLDAAGSQPLNPITRLTSFFTENQVPVVSTVDEATVNPIVDQLTAELSPEPVNAGVVLTGGQAVIEPKPANGQTVDRAKVYEGVVGFWLEPEGVEIDAKVNEPEYGDKQAQKAIKDAGVNAVDGPIILHGRDAIDGEIPTLRMGEVVTFIPENGEFRVDVNHEVAKGILLERLHETERPKKNADISFDGGSKVVTPHSDGVLINWEETFAGLNDRIIGKEAKDFDAVYVDEPATFTTEMAESATFDQVVGEFTTGGYSDASGVNITKVAQIVNGALVAPGDTFSLNNYTGPRGAAQGFVESGIILNGRADKAVGGGISQFATTLYNAAYFAGFEDISHTPHSYYISRYPAGREATVFEGQIDLVFKNNSPYPVRIVSSAGGGEVTVKLMGVKTVNVESINGGRWANTQPQTINLSGSDCSPSGGAPGFTTSDTRVIRDLSGNELSRETTTTKYDPSPIVRCG